MDSKNMRILFMGTPRFAAESLKYLINEGYNIVGAVCQPDRARDRGQKLAPPPVKELAGQRGIPVLQPEKLAGEKLMPALVKLDPELICVVAYGKILPEYVLNYPKYGCINLHASLLPKYRGAAPVQRAIMNGDEKTGLSTMFLSKGMDEGDVLDVMELPIGPDETAGELTERLSRLGAPLLAVTIDKIAAGRSVRIPQNHELATYAPLVDKSEGRLDFTKSAKEVYNTFRALTPNPGVYTRARGKILKITGLLPYHGELPAGWPGRAVCVSKKEAAIRCGDGRGVLLVCAAPEGRAEMSCCDLLNGRRLADGDALE